MLQTPGAEALLQDAGAMPAEAEALMDAGDWRNGSEKGWPAFPLSSQIPPNHHTQNPHKSPPPPGEG